MKDEVICIFTLTLDPVNFPTYEKLVAKIVAVTSEEPGVLTYEYSVNEERSVVHVIERYKTNAVLPHFDNSFAPFAEQVLALVQVAGVVVYGHPNPETRERLESFGAVFMESFDGFTRH